MQIVIALDEPGAVRLLSALTWARGWATVAKLKTDDPDESLLITSHEVILDRLETVVMAELIDQRRKQ